MPIPIISKLIEKNVTRHLFGFLNKYDLLHKSHSGFRKQLANKTCGHLPEKYVLKMGNLLEQYSLIYVKRLTL